MRGKCQNCEVEETLMYRIEFPDGIVWHACSKACADKLNFHGNSVERI